MRILLWFRGCLEGCCDKRMAWLVVCSQHLLRLSQLYVSVRRNHHHIKFLRRTERKNRKTRKRSKTSLKALRVNLIVPLALQPKTPMLKVNELRTTLCLTGVYQKSEDRVC
jgi:hypothetical protein